jgi:hypothetical protein
MPGGVGAAWNEEHAAMLHALHLAIEDTHFRRIPFVIGGVDCEKQRLDALEPG